MKHSLHRRVIAFVLIFGLLLPIAADAVVFPVSNTQRTDATTETATTEQIPESVSIEELTRGSQILKYIDEDVLATNQHVLRLPAEETLSSYAFLNQDGTMTVYYMDEAIKFLDQSGEIVEKDLSLTKTVNGFTTVTNDMGLLLPDDPSQGINISYNGYDVTLVPVGGALRKAAQNDGNSIVYPNYFGTGMSLMYTPSLDGLKEDIVLSRYTGVTSFAFRLFTNGLRLYQENDRYYLAESADAQVQIALGDVVAFDARGRFSVGNMNIETIAMGQEYLLTLSVDAAFLTDARTTYPVSIDPTLTVSDNTHGAGAIEDITIYSGTPNANCDWSYLHCGYYDSTYKVARTMFRLTGLLSSSAYQSATAGEITSVQFHIQEATGTAALPVHIYSNTGSAAWTETGATWKNAGHVLGTIYATASPGVNQAVSYDITNLVKAWKNGTESAQAGFILVSSNETSLDKAFYSSETTTTSYRSYVVMNYEVGSSFSNAIDIMSGQTVPVSITTAGEKRYFAFKPFVTGFHTIQSSNSSGDPQMWLYNSDCVEIESCDDMKPQEYNFALTYHFIKDVTYYVAVGDYNDSTSSCSFIVSSKPSADYLSTDNASIGQGHYAYITKAYSSYYYEIEVPNDGFYFFQSSMENGDAIVWIYNSDLSLVSYNDNGGGNGKFRLEVYLTAGTTYYIVIGHVGSATGTISFTPLMPTQIVEYTYNIKNTYSDMILDIHGPVEQEMAHQWTYHTDLQGQWRVKQESDGTYTIRSEYGGEYYLGVSSSAVGVNNIILSPTDTLITRWNIYETADYTLLFEPVTALGRFLYAPDANVGTELQLAWAGLDNSKYQWYIGGYDSFWDYKVPSRTLALQCTGELTTNGTWYPLIQEAVEIWNSSDAGVNIQLTSNYSRYTLVVEANKEAMKISSLYQKETLGLTTFVDEVDPKGVYEGVIIQICQELLIDDLKEITDEEKIVCTSVIAHELGHLFGLDDYRESEEDDEDDIFVGDNSLMSYGRDKTEITAPTVFDIRNVLFVYG